MAKKSNTSTTFPTMGTEAANLGRVAMPEKGKSLPKTGNAKGGASEPATATHRAGVLERNGFKGAPQMRTSYPNAPEAAQNQRNTWVVPASVGNRDFYLKRQYGQAQQ